MEMARQAKAPSRPSTTLPCHCQTLLRAHLALQQWSGQVPVCFFEVPERTKRGPEDLAEHLGGSEPITPYTRRILAGSMRKYRYLCKQLRATGLLLFTLEPR